MTTDENSSPYWLAGSCPSWCDQAHSDNDLADDRRHVSQWREPLVLSTMNPVRLDSQTGDGPELEPRAVQVWLEQGYREVEPRVRVEEDHRAGTFALTLAEADRLAWALARAVKLARVQAGDRCEHHPSHPPH